MPEFKSTLSKILPSCKFNHGLCQAPYLLIDHGAGVALIIFAIKPSPMSKHEDRRCMRHSYTKLHSIKEKK